MIELDVSRMTDRESTHTYLQQALSLPEYYGRNLDALYDCLTEMDETAICFVNTEDPPGYFDRVLPVFEDAAVDNPHISLSGLPEE